MKPIQQAPENPIPIQLAVGAFDPLSENGPPTLPPEWTLKQYPKNQSGYYILQFKGPVLQEWKDSLIAAGAIIFDYIPQFAFIVKMNEETYNAAQTMASVRWIGIYQPGYRLPPYLMSAALGKREQTLEIVVSLFQDEDITPVLTESKMIGAEIIEISEKKDRIKLKLASNKINAIAKIIGVKFIETTPLYKISQ